MEKYLTCITRGTLVLPETAMKPDLRYDIPFVKIIKKAFIS